MKNTIAMKNLPAWYLKYNTLANLGTKQSFAIVILQKIEI